jgi:hypothetical protein
MGPRLRDDAGALAEALSRANEARDAHGTLRTLEVDDDGTFVTLGLRIDDETSVSVVLMFEVRSRGDARAPSPPMRDANAEISAQLARRKIWSGVRVRAPRARAEDAYRGRRRVSSRAR